jgi:hypothetical protein
MTLYRRFLVGITVVGFTVANSPSYAKAPDLVPWKLELVNYTCVQTHILIATLHVEIKNQGLGTAKLPGSLSWRPIVPDMVFT